MTHTSSQRPFVRVVNGVIAAALAAALLVASWSMVRLLDLSRANIEAQGVWIGGHARKITAVTPGGAADRAGIRPGDILEFDPRRDADWILAGYRDMPEGFRATVPVRRADGGKELVSIVPERVAYLPTVNDRAAWLARLTSFTVTTLLAVLMVWARPCLMTWALFLGNVSGFGVLPWNASRLAFTATEAALDLYAFLPAVTIPQSVMLVVFALCFPGNSANRWPPSKRVLGAAGLISVMAIMALTVGRQALIPFERDTFTKMAVFNLALMVLSDLGAMGALVQTYRSSNEQARALLKWAILGMSVSLAALALGATFGSGSAMVSSNAVSSMPATSANWVFAVFAVVWWLSIAYSILRARVLDVQFAISRTLAYGAVTTLALVLLATVHWLLGRVIEQSRLAIGLEGIAAIGLGLVLHRTSHGINVLVDRVLFRKHHQAEERLRRVTAALPFASDERSIAESLVAEPVRNLDLASAALFYRESAEGPLRRVLAQGWSEAHAASLKSDSLLVRYLQAEHAPLKLDDSQLLPADVPAGAALPVLAIPIVNQHVLAAVVLYGAHTNHTLLDPDEIALLHALAKAAATSHQQVRIAMLQREVATLSSENAVEKARVEQLEASAAELRALVRAGMVSGS